MSHYTEGTEHPITVGALREIMSAQAKEVEELRASLASVTKERDAALAKAGEYMAANPRMVGGRTAADWRARAATARREALEEAANHLESFCRLKQPWGLGMPYHDSCPDCRAGRIVRALAETKAEETKP